MSLHPGPCAKGLIVLLMILLGYACQSWGQQQTSNNDNWKQIYEQLRICALTGGSSHVHNLTLKRDRGVMTFEDGTFYFGAPVAGQVREAIFIGSGKFSAEPPSDFERDNLRRMLNDDTVSEIFVAAVLRFTDDTYSVIGHGLDPKGIAPSEAEQLASEFDRRFLNETGANVSSRELISILNRESPGFFLGEFDRGKGKRFVFLLDRQCRIPAANFGIDAGEKGLILGEIEEGESGQVFSGTDVWMAFYALEEYQSRRVGYAHTYTLVDVTHYDLSVDLREPQKALALTARMDLLARRGDIRAVPFKLSEDLGFSARAEHHLGLRVKAVRLAGGSPLDFVQEPMEGGFTLLLPAAPSAGEKLSVEADVQGNFMYHWNAIDTFYPLSNSSWYPRNSSLQRSTFDLKFVHRKNTHVASVGQLVQEKASPDNADERVTEYRMDQPVPFATFAAGHFEVHTDTTKLPNGAPLSIELYSIGGREFPIKEDFMLAEMNNCVRYFSALFGPYQYPVFRAVLHPFGFGQGFPTMLMIPKADLAQKRTFSFIAHETSHQWWGDLVLWRSYRDLWLSEGFAEYSGASYTGLRTKAATELDLIDEMRAVLKYPPGTQARVGEGRLADVGPLILGHRLETRNTRGAYWGLVYNKGALVLRMLHFLFTNPQTGEGQAFSDMMSDFVRRYQNQAASTEDFFAVANEHSKGTELAKQFGYKDLNWFLRQWVLQSYLPIYRLEYSIDAAPGGHFVLKGTLYQDGVPEKERWFMPIPLALQFSGGKKAMAVLAAYGPRTPVNLPVGESPLKVELDPYRWVLSEKTTAKQISPFVSRAAP